VYVTQLELEEWFLIELAFWSISTNMQDKREIDLDMKITQNVLRHVHGTTGARGLVSYLMGFSAISQQNAQDKSEVRFDGFLSIMFRSNFVP
jgi:hypothetical protein